jgi:hypothetical protein
MTARERDVLSMTGDIPGNLVFRRGDVNTHVSMIVSVHWTSTLDYWPLGDS